MHEKCVNAWDRMLSLQPQCAAPDTTAFTNQQSSQGHNTLPRPQSRSLITRCASFVRLFFLADLRVCECEVSEHNRVVLKGRLRSAGGTIIFMNCSSVICTAFPSPGFTPAA